MSSRHLAVVGAILLGSVLTACTSSGGQNSTDTLPNSAPVPAASNAAPAPSQPPPSAAPVAGSVVASSSRPSSIAGIWQPSDGSALKTIEDGGACTGMYYDGTTPLDIGGPMTCVLSQNESNGYYILVVRQPPNQASYQVRFSGDNTMTMYTSANLKIVTLTRQ